jgi:hypothetical protein
MNVTTKQLMEIIGEQQVQIRILESQIKLMQLQRSSDGEDCPKEEKGGGE